MSSNNRTLRTNIKNIIMGLFSVALIAFNINYAVADEETETYGGIIIENARVETDSKKPKAFLKMKISNLSQSGITLVGIRTENFNQAKILMEQPWKSSIRVDSLTILEEETLDLDTSHIRVELSGLNRAVKAGDIIQFELLFNNQVISAAADIHISKS